MRRRLLGLGLGAALAAAVALALVFAVFAGAGSNKTMVEADPLTGYQEATRAGNSSSGSGTFEATIDGATAPTITYTLTYVGLSGPPLFAHIHFGNRFDSGGISAFLCGSGGKPPCPPGTTAEATVTGTITPADVIGPVNQGIGPATSRSSSTRCAPASRTSTSTRRSSRPARSAARPTTTTTSARFGSGGVFRQAPPPRCRASRHAGITAETDGGARRATPASV